MTGLIWGMATWASPPFIPPGSGWPFSVKRPDRSATTWLPTHPGAGVYNDLMVMRLSDRAVFMLNDVADGNNGVNGGTLHAILLSCWRPDPVDGL